MWHGEYRGMRVYGWILQGEGDERPSIAYELYDLVPLASAMHDPHYYDAWNSDGTYLFVLLVDGRLPKGADLSAICDGLEREEKE